MTAIRRSLALSVSANLSSIAISLVLVIVVSRIMAPQVVGQFVMAYSVILLLDPLREMQLSSYVIQRDKMSPAAMRPVVFVAMLTAAGALLVCALAAMVFRWTYPGTSVAECLLIMSLGYVFLGLTQPAVAMLNRNLQYGSLLVIKLAGALAKGAVTLCLAFGGWGAISLAWGIVAEASLSLLALGMVRARYRLVRPHRAGSRQVLAYCLQFAGAQQMAQVSAALAPLLIGSFQGLGVAAFYNRATTVVRLFRSSIELAVMPIALANFSSVRGDPARLRTTYLSAIGNLTAVSWPALAFLVVMAEPLVYTIFGQRWAATAPLIQLLCITAMIYSATALSAQLHGALDQTKALLMRESFMQVPRLIVLVLCAMISAEAAILGLATVATVGFFVNQAMLRKALDLTFVHFLAAIARSALVTILVALALVAARWTWPSGGRHWLDLLYFCMFFGLLWLAALFLTRHPIRLELRNLPGQLGARKAQ